MVKVILDLSHPTTPVLEWEAHLGSRFPFKITFCYDPLSSELMIRTHGAAAIATLGAVVTRCGLISGLDHSKAPPKSHQGKVEIQHE
jgi:hypothetical protein